MTEKNINIAWVTRSFLDYRIPVFAELDKLVNGRLHLIYSGDYVPQSVQLKAKQVLGDRAIAMHGEWKLGAEDRNFMANANVSVRFQPGLYKMIKSINPDVIVCDGFFKWTFSALLYRIINRIPLVVNYERTFRTERKVQWYRKIYRKLAIRFIDAMNCSGELCTEYTLSLGMPAANIKTGHMVADIDCMHEKANKIPFEEVRGLKNSLGVASLVFIYVGRLHSLKGCKELLSAWKVIEEKYSGSATLLFVGSGQQESELKDLCQKEGLSHVVFVGHVDYEEIAIYYRVADVFVIPTLEDNWSLVVPEAMSCRLPILCSKFNGCWPEMVHEGENGWVFDPLDTDDLVRVLNLCMVNRQKLSEMGDKAYDVVQKFNPQAGAESILDTCRLGLRHRMPSNS